MSAGRQPNEADWQIACVWRTLPSRRFAKWSLSHQPPEGKTLGMPLPLFLQLKSFCDIVAISRPFDNFDIRIYYAS